MLITYEDTLTINFIDNILVFGSDEQEHNKEVDYILRVLQENNVLLNTEKCIQTKRNRMAQFIYLGYQV